jgi:hypothetical protein
MNIKIIPPGKELQANEYIAFLLCTSLSAMSNYYIKSTYSKNENRET